MPRLAPHLLALALIAATSGCKDQGPDRAPAQVTISSPPGTTITSGTTVTLTASVTNAAGTVLSGNTAEWTSTDATIASVTSTGVVTAIHAGSAQITATVGTVHSLPITLTVTPGAAAQLALRTQPAGGVSALPLTTQPVIEIRDAAGNLVSSSTDVVTAIIATGGGTITG
ncbi:MAG TPA: Ig-like domain-containing protein, partial [Gemmatimonadaceae bacterium]